MPAWGIALNPGLSQNPRIPNPFVMQPSLRHGDEAARSPGPSGGSDGPLPIHFFSLAFNGEPFVRHPIHVLRELPFPWHWHVVGGLAETEPARLSARPSGSSIGGKLSHPGLTADSTLSYLDRLAAQYPDRLTIYRPPGGLSWPSRQRMFNAPLSSIDEECLLWRLDPGELWSVEQIIRARELFLACPEKTAALYYCHFFVGPKLVVTTRGTYGNPGRREWLRTWRFSPGCQWTPEEQPRLCRRVQGQDMDLAVINPLWQAETEAHNLVFQRFAWAVRSQAEFQEVCCGYDQAALHWQRLQDHRRFPVLLRDFFPWVSDQARVDRVKSLGIVPLARRSAFRRWTVLVRQPAADPIPPPVRHLSPTTEPERILLVRIDAIGDAVLAASILPHLHDRFPSARLAVVCQEQVRELYEACPLVGQIIAFDKRRILADEPYRANVLIEIERYRAQLVLNATHSRSSLDEVLTLSNSAPEKVGLESDLWNISPADRRRWLPRYTRLVPSPDPFRSELDRCRDFLAGLNIAAQELSPRIWTTGADEEHARALFQQHRLESARTIAVCPGAQHEIRVYPHYARALRELENYRFIILGGPDAADQCRQIAGDLPGSINLAGQTTLRHLASLLRRCRLYVGAESAGAHIACAVETPNVVVLGGGHFGRFMPYSPLTSAACLPLDCFGCNWACRYDRPHCIRDLAPEVLGEAIRGGLSEPAAKPRIFTQRREQWNPGSGAPAWQNCERLLPGARAEIL